VTIDYRRFDRGEAAGLADFLTGETWPFHAGGPENAEDVCRRVADSEYHGDDTETWWILDGGEQIGLIQLTDLGDDAGRCCATATPRSRTTVRPGPIRPERTTTPSATRSSAATGNPDQ
jgi:hypothetical protein